MIIDSLVWLLLYVHRHGSALGVADTSEPIVGCEVNTPGLEPETLQSVTNLNALTLSD
jgi:hypothetical protein